MAWEKLGSTSVSGATANTSWKELGRQTLSGSGDVMTTGTITAKDNLMILYYGDADGEMINKLTFNDDTGNNYAYRLSDGWGSDSTTTSNAFLEFATSSTSNEFSVANVVNVATQEKLVELNHAGQNTAGAGTAPRSRELVGKWANTSNAITKVTATNSQSGSFGSGSELIVLGYDNDEADSGTNFWQELKSVELSSSATSLDTGTFAKKKYLWINFFASGGGNIMGRVGTDSIDTGNNYAHNRSYNNGTGTQTSGASAFEGGSNATSNGMFGSLFIFNKTDQEKLMILEMISNTTSGAGNVPDRRQQICKWVNTSDQINIFQIRDDGLTEAYSSAFIKVYGAD